ncbi:MAG: XdhC family protein [Gammaproteobacteria bacterium]|nr:XdhC family protein [Gammaproteobacteria bacterium]
MNHHADDSMVLEAAHDWLQQGRRVALVMVVRTWGSSPRPPGSLLAMNDRGQFVGSVSGGCVEQTLVSRFGNGEIAGPGPTLLDFGVDRAEAGRLGLPCGGRLELLVEHLDAPQPLALLLQRIARGELVARRLCLQTGEASLHAGKAGTELQTSETDIIRTFGPAWRLLLVGDGQLAGHLARMALELDYAVTICEPRDGFSSPMPLAGVTYTRDMPDDAVRALADQARTAIVTLAHDPRQDDLALSAALESQAFYIGALGSTRSAAARSTRLRSLGYTSGQLARIHGPAGVPIGSKRPAEIALSILAEITATRNAVAHSSDLHAARASG